MKPTVIDPYHLTPQVMEFILGTEPKDITPAGLRLRTEFSESTFYSLMYDHWFAYVRLRGKLTEALLSLDLRYESTEQLKVRVSCNGINEDVLGVAMVLLQHYGWGYFEARTCGYSKIRYSDGYVTHDLWEFTLYRSRPKVEIHYCPEYDHHYIDPFFREEVEVYTGALGYCAEYDHAVLNDKQYVKLKEHLDAVSK